MKIKKILIANRGEIAIRVIRACREMGISCVSVYSRDDTKSLFYRLADQAHLIQGNDLKSTYLDGEKILKIAKRAGCDAVHPGYGFLSENAEFVAACESAGVKFIGPRAATMKKAGNKALIKKIMETNGIPVLPTVRTSGSAKAMRAAAAQIGYPLIIKPSFGGGGKGMRVVREESELDDAVRFARSIGQSAFGNAAFYIEKCLERPRHIEVQILADSQRNIIDLGERDCSIQRRHQKLIEETPSPALTDRQRKKVAGLARRAAAAIGYENAGTVEFLYQDGEFYFLEVNARIQVEHPVTELVTGLDLIKKQILIAAGVPLSERAMRAKPRGWAIECRINAEDPDKNFLPCPGKITGYRSPGGIGVRVDSGVFMGITIPAQFDSLVSKLSVWGHDRDEATARMRRALNEYVILGIKTTLPYYRAVFREENYLRGDYDTGYVERARNDHKLIMAQLQKTGRSHDKLLKSIFEHNFVYIPVADANYTEEDY